MMGRGAPLTTISSEMIALRSSLTNDILLRDRRSNHAVIASCSRMNSRSDAKRCGQALCGFDQILATDQSTVGQFAVALSQLSQAGHTVLPGAVICADTFSTFLTQIDWDFPLLQHFPQSNLHLKVDQPLQLRAIAQAIGQGITTTPLPPEWVADWLDVLAVFNGKLARFMPSLWLPPPHEPLPLQFNGLLKPRYGLIEPNGLATSIKQLWSSLFSAPSLFFWERSGIPLEQLRLAVVIQPLPIRPQMEFCRDQDQESICGQNDTQLSESLSLPVSGFVEITATHLYLQATYGLSESLVQGEVLPDTYEVHFSTGTVHRQLGHKTHAYWGPELVPLDAKWHQQFTLDDPALQALIALFETISLPEDPPALTLEWLLSPKLATVHAVTEPITILGLWDELPFPIDHQPSMSLSARSINSGGEANHAVTIPPHLRPYRLGSGLPAASGQRIATAWVTQDLKQETPVSLVDQILVVPSIQPDDLPWLKQVAGIVCEQGGLTCHGAILARELGLPAVVGMAQSTTCLHTGQLLFLDGDHGEVFELKPSTIVPRVSAWPQPPSAEPLQLSSPSQPLSTQLWVNLSQPSSIDRARGLPIEGVGLLRSEWMFLDILEQQHPHRWFQQGRQAELLTRMKTKIQAFAQGFALRPVFYRSLDLRSPELATLIGSNDLEPIEANPVLGLRGTSRYVREPQLFDLELAALAQLRQQGYDNLNLLLPFVRSIEEFCFCRDRIIAAGLTLSPQFQVWIMAEVPSVLFLLPEYVQAGVQGIAIGTNDLTQLLLGVDRNHSLLTPTLNECHPAVRAAITHLIQTARTLGIPCSMCGQATVHYPDLIVQAVTAGITALSVDIDAVVQTREAIAQAEQHRGARVEALPQLHPFPPLL